LIIAMSRDAAENPTRRISFGRFVLELPGGRLTSDGRDIPLRPQTLSVLQYLAHRAGRRVPTDELMEAVWPGLIGSDDNLVQSIGELRRVLGDVDSRLIVYDLEQGALLDPTAAAPERRNARGVRPLRFRWMYGLIAPLVLALAFTVIWFMTSREPAAPAASAHPAIAVLPFLDQSDTPELAPRAERFTQDLIAVLGRRSTLTVKSWAEVAVYQGALAQPGEIARVLAVQYQVEGSVRVADDQLRVSAQLVDVQGKVLWSARYVERPADVAALQERMAGEIVGALSARL
jgi:TolB-like protein